MSVTRIIHERVRSPMRGYTRTPSEHWWAFSLVDGRCMPLETCDPVLFTVRMEIAQRRLDAMLRPYLRGEFDDDWRIGIIENILPSSRSEIVRLRLLSGNYLEFEAPIDSDQELSSTLADRTVYPAAREYHLNGQRVIEHARPRDLTFAFLTPEERERWWWAFSVVTGQAISLWQGTNYAEQDHPPLATLAAISRRHRAVMHESDWVICRVLSAERIAPEPPSQERERVMVESYHGVRFTFDAPLLYGSNSSVPGPGDALQRIEDYDACVFPGCDLRRLVSRPFCWRHSCQPWDASMIALRLRYLTALLRSREEREPAEEIRSMVNFLNLIKAPTEPTKPSRPFDRSLDL